MVRFVVMFAAWMVFGNWVYDEIELSFPRAVPYIDAALDKVAIPTHDQWNPEALAERIEGVSSAVAALSGEAFPRLAEVEQALDKPSKAKDALAMLDAPNARRAFERF